MGRYNPNIVGDITVAREFGLFGDHIADLIIGDQKNNCYCFIEFEDASKTSIFKTGAKATPEWSSRYEHGYSQLIDWILWLDHNEGNAAFLQRFGCASIEYNMLLVIGRDRDLSSPALRQRFDWRNNSVVVASKKVHCITYDKLYEDLSYRSKMLP